MSNTIPDDVMRAARAIAMANGCAAGDFATYLPHARAVIEALNPPSSLPRSSPAETTPDAALLPASGNLSIVATTKGESDAKSADNASENLDLIVGRREALYGSGHQPTIETATDNAPRESAADEISRTHSDWITWNGGECPVAPDTRVDVKSRRGDVSCDYRASFWDGDPSWWRHKSWNHDNDIIAYRIVPANLTQHEASL